MHSEHIYEPVTEIELQDCQAQFSLKHDSPWNNFKPAIHCAGSSEVHHDSVSGKLLCKGGEVVIQCPSSRNINLIAQQCKISGIHPGGQVSVKSCDLHLSPRPHSKANLWTASLRDMGFIVGLSALLTLVFSPVFMPPDKMEYMLIAGASIYLGLNGHTSRALTLSISTGALALCLPIVYPSMHQPNWHFEPSLTYALKITLYLVLWGAGKKMKDWYRGSIA
jgi:hypothetical protein